MVFVSVFQMNVLLKLDTILDMQKQQLTLLRRIASASSATVQVVDLQYILPKPLKTTDLQEFEQKLENSAFRSNLISHRFHQL